MVHKTRLATLATALASLALSATAVQAATPTTLSPVSGKTTKVRGDLKSGKTVPLSWASRSQIACFPATRFKHFDGHHVFYKMRLPAKSKLTITAQPDKGVDLSLYAYTGSGVKPPPMVYSTVSCESSYLKGETSKSVTKNPGKPESVFLNATTNGYDVIIGVAGAHKARKGGFELKVDLVTAGPGVADTGPPPTQTIFARAGKTVATKGDIKRGKRLPLSWASNSNVACWPKTRDQHFDGKHVAFKTKLPKHSTMEIELIPAKGKDLSLYAYSASGHPLPPKLYKAICEASYLYGEKSVSVKSNPGKPEKVKLVAINNPYDVVIGVAGAGKLDSGSFTLNVKLSATVKQVADTGPPPSKPLTAKSGKTVSVKGDIAKGKKLPLRWAANSNVACWPTTRNQHFDGKHVVYKTKQPPESTMTITLKPAKGKDLSLYAYAASGHPLPPKLYGARCEASYLMGEKSISVKANPGKPEQVKMVAIKNGYDIVIGVAGAGALDKGAFTLDVALTPKVQKVADTGPPPASTVTAKPGKTVTVSGDIKKGKVLPLSWAANSNVACWPTTRDQHFDGKHIAFKTKLPRHSTMEIELIPAKGKDLSLYAYSASGHPLPPKLYKAICEASYLYGERSISVKSNPGKPEKVKLVAINNPYDVVIGVAGAGKLDSGSFKLNVKLSAKVETVADTGPPPSRTISAFPNKTTSTKGDIRTGKRLPLAWASNSNVACWPKTRDQHFDGKHVVYKTKLPKKSTMTITLKPKKGKDLSLYAYAAGGHPLPPKLYRARCEASYLFGEKSISVTSNPGKPEQVKLVAINNGYDVVIGVAGAGKLDSGAFELEVKLDTAGDGVADTGPPPAQTTTLTKGKTVTVTGDIKGGKLLPLAWATNSNVACWPATRNQHFDGHHVAYKVKLPPRTKLKVELIPEKGADMSVYAYSASGHPLPPKLYRARCEAGYFGSKGGKEKVSLQGSMTATYDVVVAVAGAGKAAKGKYTLKMTIE